MQPINHRPFVPLPSPPQSFSNRVSQLVKSLNCWPSQPPDTLLVEPQEATLPYLLDYAAAPKIFAEPLDDLSNLSPVQLLRLAALMTLPEAPQAANLPSGARQYMEILQTRSTLAQDIQRIKQIEEFSEEEKYAAIAHYIERFNIYLKDVDQEKILRLVPYLHTVNLQGFGNIALGKQIVKKCPHLVVLKLNDGRFLEGITTLPHCRQLHCNHIPLRALPKLPRCLDLNCSGCIHLRELPALPLCQELDCHNCPHLRVLPELPLCKMLDCRFCTNMRSLPQLPSCERLECSLCIFLRFLPPLPLCKELNCACCTALIALPALPKCEKVVLFKCTALRTIPALPVCQMINCHRCTALTALPTLPHCRQLLCSFCPLHELPELPWHAYVNSNDEGSTTVQFSGLKIEIEKFAAQPVTLLLLLGEYLLKNKPFPNIYYFENGIPNQAIDVGGVRRDFVTKLCLTLFNELKMEDNFPLAAKGDERAYRSLGCLLAHCYQENSFYKTGPLFDPGVYRCMLTPHPGSDEWFLTNYLHLIKAPDLDRESDLTKLAYLAEPAAADLSKYTRSYFNNPKNRAALRQTLLLRAKEHPQLIAISWMAQEFRKRVPNITGDLQKRIEGILSNEALKQKLSISDLKTERYLTNWIDTHEDLLEKFVYAVTGSRALCSNRIIVEVYNRDKNFIPVAHTCSFTLELSRNYENQEVFDQKMGCFLENALAGSGFTLA